MHLTYQHGHFMWHELITTDPEGAAAFYAHVAGWKTNYYYPAGSSKPYTTWLDAWGPLGALLSLDDDAHESGISSHWFANVMVRNLEVCIARVEASGGKLLRGPEAMGTVGRWAVIQDPQGVKLAVFAAKDPLEARHPAKHGGVTWNELMSTDHRAAFEFYRSIFDWQVLRTVDPGAPGEYIVYGTYGESLGGMFTRPSDHPLAIGWVYYIQVADLEVARVRAEEQGARVVTHSVVIPGRGRTALIIDPQGAPVALREAVTRGDPWEWGCLS
jgi:predicted enzyme related to lactoylglutathione lyase